MGTTMTHEQAIDALKQHGCGRWITTSSCDSCFVDALGIETLPEETIRRVKAVVAVGLQASKLLKDLEVLRD